MFAAVDGYEQLPNVPELVRLSVSGPMVAGEGLEPPTPGL